MLQPANAQPALPENIVDMSASQRTWSGVTIGITEYRCAGQVLHHLGNQNDTRLSVVLEETGGQCEPRLREHQPCPIAYIPRHMHFAPMGMEVWGYTAGVQFVKDATLRFDVAGLGERQAQKFDATAIGTPRLRFADERIWTLVKLLSDAVGDPDPSAQLYGDGLTTAIVACMLGSPQDVRQAHVGLAAWQLERVVEYLDAHLPRRVELAQLALLSRLSPSHFSRAFKVSTGMAPYHWQLASRVRRAQALLVNSDASLEQVAEATGFADAVHFGRTFRKLIGATPAAWRRDRKT